MDLLPSSGAAEYEAYHGVLPTFTLKVGQVSIPPETLIGIIVSIIVVVILMLLFRYAKIGLAMRATAEDEQVVQSVGIKVTTIYAISWIIACVVGVVSGIILGGVSGVMVSMSEVGMKAFAVVLLGGIDSIGGAIIAGIIVGHTGECRRRLPRPAAAFRRRSGERFPIYRYHYCFDL